MYSVAPETIKLCDSLASSEYHISELTLMKNAAAECFRIIKPLIKNSDKITILCGKGNNGGDGYELSRILKKEWFDVCAVNVFGCPPTTESALSVYNSFLNDGGTVLSSDNAKERIENSDVLIDAIFGVGFYGALSESDISGSLISLCNGCNALKIAIDVPSGINSKDGSVSGITFIADYTATLAFYKTGSLSYPAREYCGKILLGKIGIPKALEEQLPYDALIPDDMYISSVIRERKPNTHKGTYGRLMMYCASRYMTGAGILAANAALRSGVGLVNIVRDDETLKILQHHLTEPVFTPFDATEKDSEDILLSHTKKATAILIGCGLGNAECDRKSVFSLIKNSNSPIILDADGINAICGNINILKEAKYPVILTPHPLEFSRLTGIDTETIMQNRIKYATEFSKENRCIIILKGASTVISSYDGSLAICTCGGPGLSKGGSGDVLAGLCASLRAQGISDFDSAVCSVYIHAKAGDILSEDISVSGFLPSDLPLMIAKLLP